MTIKTKNEHKNDHQDEEKPYLDHIYDDIIIAPLAALFCAQTNKLCLCAQSELFFAHH